MAKRWRDETRTAVMTDGDLRTDSGNGDDVDDSETLARALNEKRAAAASGGAVESTQGTAPGRPRIVPAGVVGLLVGLLVVGLVYAGMEIFQLLLKTPAGGAIGAIALVGVIIFATLVGGWLMKRRGLPDPHATSLLAVLLMLIVTMAFLLDFVFTRWMAIGTPVLGAATYAVSHWLVARFS